MPASGGLPATSSDIHDLTRLGRWFHAIAEAVPDLVYAFDPQGRMLYASPALLALWQRPASDVEGRTLLEIGYPPDEAARVTGQVREVARSGRMLRASGTIPPQMPSGDSSFEYILSPVFAGDGTVETVAGIARDTTVATRMADRLEESEQRYRSLFETMDEGFCIIEMLFDEAGEPSDYRFLEVNPAFERQTGLSNAVGRRMREIAPAHEKHWFELYGRVALEGGSARFEQHAAALGDRWYEVHAFRTGAPEQRRVAVLFNDISARVAAEASLRESEARFRRAFDIETVGVIFFGIDGCITEANDAFLGMSGYTRQDLEQGLLRWDVMTPPEWMAQSHAAVDELVTTGRTTPYEKEYLRKDGSRWWALFAARRISETGGVEFVLDISERKQADERQGLMMREIDHRARNMLATIQALVNLTAFHTQDVDEFVAAVQERIAAMSHAQDLIARARGQGASLRTLVADPLSPYVAERPEALRLRGPSLTLKPEAAMALSLVIHELATNAAKYGALSSPKGRVSLNWRQEGDGALALEWRESGGPLVSEPKRKGFGSTLISASLAGGVGGSAVVRFEPGGLECSIRLPASQLSQAGPAPRPAPVPSAAPAGKPRPDRPRILVVEDQPLIALEARAGLEATGYQVIGPAHTLEDALFIARTEPLDAAVLDIDIAGQPVYAVAEVLKERRIPFVFVSGYRTESLDPAYRAHPLLSKPLRAAAIARALGELAAPA